MRSGTTSEHAEEDTDPRTAPVAAAASGIASSVAPGLAAAVAAGLAAATLAPLPAAAVLGERPPPGPDGVAAESVPVAPLPTASTFPTAATPTPRIGVREIDVPRGAAARASTTSVGGKQVVAAVQRHSTAQFDLVGVTWRRGTAPADVEVEVRTHDDRGWSAWQELHFHPDEGPAPGEESGVVRDGTVPLWTGDADGVQARVLSAEGTAPLDPDLTLVDPGSIPAAADAPTGTTDASAPAAADPAAGSAVAVEPAVVHGPVDSADATAVATAAPRLVSRRQWGADPRLKSRCDSPVRARTLKMAFVHHTAGTNRYTRSESPAIVRSVYAYHTQGQGWCDIGYNFLVDRFGTVYVGRAGGVNTPVRGAHTGDYNTGSVGVSLMGNFEKARPSRAMRGAVSRLLAWKLSSYYRHPHSKARLAGTRFERISGHRDAMSTACPGRYAYRWLPALRDRVTARVGSIETPVYRKWVRLQQNGIRLGSPFRGEARATGGGLKTNFARGWIFWDEGAGAHATGGDIYRRWRRTGLAGGVLGYPTTDIQPTRGHGGTNQAFRRGRIYRTSRHGAVAIWGRISSRYRKTGLASGRLGVPVRNQYSTRRGWAADFQHGRITWNTSTGRVRVRTY